MLVANKHNVNEIHVDDLDQIQYNVIPLGDLLSVVIVKELID